MPNRCISTSPAIPCGAAGAHCGGIGIKLGCWRARCSKEANALALGVSYCAPFKNTTARSSAMPPACVRETFPCLGGRASPAWEGELPPLGRESFPRLGGRASPAWEGGVPPLGRETFPRLGGRVSPAWEGDLPLLGKEDDNYLQVWAVFP